MVTLIFLAFGRDRTLMWIQIVIDVKMCQHLGPEQFVAVATIKKLVGVPN